MKIENPSLPEISIVLTLENKAKNLFKILDSLKNQTFHNWEIVIVDNASKDNAYNFIQPFFDKGMHIRYIRQQKLSESMSRNVGIQAAMGKYITFIGADDKFLPDHLESRYYYIQKNKLDLIQGGIEVIGLTKIPDPQDTSKRISIYESPFGYSFFGKKSIFIELNGFKDVLFHDYDLWKRAEAKFKVANIEAPVTYYHTRLL